MDPVQAFIEYANVHNVSGFLYSSYFPPVSMKWKASLTDGKSGNQTSKWASTVEDACRTCLEQFKAGKFDPMPLTEERSGADEYKPDPIHGDPEADETDAWPDSPVEDDLEDLEPDYQYETD